MKSEKIINKLRRFNRIAILVVLLILGLRFLSTIETTYTMNGSVVSNDNGTIILEDSTGNIWAMDDVESHPEIGTKVFIHFNNNHTDTNRKDDSITKIELR